MRKFYTENCLVSQIFIKDKNKTVDQVLTETSKKAGGEAKIERFMRFEIG